MGHRRHDDGNGRRGGLAGASDLDVGALRERGDRDAFDVNSVPVAVVAIRRGAILLAESVVPRGPCWLLRGDQFREVVDDLGASGTL